MRSLLKGLILLCILFNFSNLFSVDEKDDFVYDLALATQGISVSQYNTGVNYSLGRGIDKDMEKACVSGINEQMNRAILRHLLI